MQHSYNSVNQLKRVHIIKKFIYLKTLKGICPRFFEPPRETEIGSKDRGQIPRNFFLADKHNTLKKLGGSKNGGFLRWRF